MRILIPIVAIAFFTFIAGCSESPTDTASPQSTKAAEDGVPWSLENSTWLGIFEGVGPNPANWFPVECSRATFEVPANTTRLLATMERPPPVDTSGSAGILALILRAPNEDVHDVSIFTGGSPTNSTLQMELDDPSRGTWIVQVGGVPAAVNQYVDVTVRLEGIGIGPDELVFHQKENPMPVECRERPT